MTPRYGGRERGRLDAISPHAQVYLLCAFSLATVGLLVVAVFLSLAPTRNSLTAADSGLLPQVARLERAQERYLATAEAFRSAAAADPTGRSAAIDALTQLNTEGATAWRAYRAAAIGLPGEGRLQQDFLHHRQEAVDAGARFLTTTSPSAADFAAVTASVDEIRRDLDAIRVLYDVRIQHTLRDARQSIAETQRDIFVVSGIALLGLLVAYGLAARSAKVRERRTVALDRALHADAQRSDLEARVQRALEMVSDEASSYPLVARALGIAAPTLPAEFLLADSSRAHFRQVGSSDATGGPGCPVMSPGDCPAASRGQTMIWDSSRALDACPHLRGRPTGDCSAACVPVSVGGNTVGVVHATAPDEQPPDEVVVDRYELVARRAGERIGMLRAFARSETQAHTDPLTGLLNRRSLEEHVRSLIEQGTSYIAAYGDLDHFKQLNDVHGHDAGDQALRLFARVMRDGVRPVDVVARYGGEEFVVVLPDVTVSDAHVVVNRIRGRLRDAQTGTSRFTVSFGLAASRPERTFSETLELADAALLEAKAAGRDRVVIAGADDTQSPGSVAAAATTEAPTVSRSSS